MIWPNQGHWWPGQRRRGVRRAAQLDHQLVWWKTGCRWYRGPYWPLKATQCASGRWQSFHRWNSRPTYLTKSAVLSIKKKAVVVVITNHHFSFSQTEYWLSLSRAALTQVKQIEREGAVSISVVECGGWRAILIHRHYTRYSSARWVKEDGKNPTIGVGECVYVCVWVSECADRHISTPPSSTTTISPLSPLIFSINENRHPVFLVGLTVVVWFHATLGTEALFNTIKLALAHRIAIRLFGMFLGVLNRSVLYS